MHSTYVVWNAGAGQEAAVQAPTEAEKGSRQRQASSSDTDASQPDMDLQKALKIVSKHYVTRNIVATLCSIQHHLHAIASACLVCWFRALAA